MGWIIIRDRVSWSFSIEPFVGWVIEWGSTLSSWTTLTTWESSLVTFAAWIFSHTTISRISGVTVAISSRLIRLSRLAAEKTCKLRFERSWKSEGVHWHLFSPDAVSLHQVHVFHVLSMWWWFRVHLVGSHIIFACRRCTWSIVCGWFPLILSSLSLIFSQLEQDGLKMVFEYPPGDEFVFSSPEEPRLFGTKYEVDEIEVPNSIYVIKVFNIIEVAVLSWVQAFIIIILNSVD